MPIFQNTHPSPGSPPSSNLLSHPTHPSGDDDADVGLSELRSHKLSFAKATGAGLDAMARHESVDDYVVFDPLLEKSKGKFSRAAQAEKKRGKEWAGRPVT